MAQDQLGYFRELLAPELEDGLLRVDTMDGDVRLTPLLILSPANHPSASSGGILRSVNHCTNGERRCCCAVVLFFVCFILFYFFGVVVVVVVVVVFLGRCRSSSVRRCRPSGASC